MGWLIQDAPLGQTPDAYLRSVCETLTREHMERGDKATILASSFVGKTWYAACHIQLKPCKGYPNGLDQITAYVFLTCGNARRGFGYKDMTETMGPCECDCPAYILALLTPVEKLDHAGYAADWRARCVARAAQKRTIKSIRPKVGDRVKFAEPLSYSGIMLQEFVVVPTPRRRRGLIGTPVDGHGLYRLPLDKLTNATIGYAPKSGDFS